MTRTNDPEATSATDGNSDADVISSYVAAVASAAPTPGGGSVAAVVGSLAAALGEMVCNLTIGKTDIADSEKLLRESRAALTHRRSDLLDLAGDDERAYGAYRAAAALPKATDAEKRLRREAMQGALLGAAKVPLRTAASAAALFPHLEASARFGNPHVLSDTLVATILAEAAVRAAAVNVRVNTAMLKDRAAAESLDRQIAAITREVQDAAERIEALVAKRR